MVRGDDNVCNEARQQIHQIKVCYHCFAAGAGAGENNSGKESSSSAGHDVGGSNSSSTTSSRPPVVVSTDSDMSDTGITLSFSNSRRLALLLRSCLECLFVANSNAPTNNIVAAAVDRCYSLDTHRARTYGAALVALFRQHSIHASLGLIDIINLITYLAGHTERPLRRLAVDLTLLVGPNALWQTQSRAPRSMTLAARAPTPVRAFINTSAPSQSQPPPPPPPPPPSSSSSSSSTTTTTATATKQ